MINVTDTKEQLKRKFVVFLAVAAAVGIVFTVVSHLFREKQFQKTVTAIADLRESYSTIISEKVSEKLKDLDLEFETDVKASGTLSFEMNSASWYCWRESWSVTLYVSDRFDSIGDRRQYEYLCDYQRQAKSALRDVVEEKLPETYELKQSVTEQIQKRKSDHIWYDDDYSFIVETAENRYEYSPKTNAYYDYFVLNGKEHYIKKDRKETTIKRTTPTPTPRISSSTSRKSYVFDYDDVHNYTDPEDFWEDHEDEFDDSEDAWDYWEENQ